MNWDKKKSKTHEDSYDFCMITEWLIRVFVSLDKEIFCPLTVLNRLKNFCYKKHIKLRDFGGFCKRKTLGVESKGHTLK